MFEENSQSEHAGFMVIGFAFAVIAIHQQIATIGVAAGFLTGLAFQRYFDYNSDIE